MTLSNPITLERDPVCGMNWNPASAKYVHEHARKKYYFCSAGCAEKFKAQPQRYLNNPAPASSQLVMLGVPGAPKSVPSQPGTAHTTSQKVVSTAAVKPNTVAEPAYVCPMCPEVREMKPGACPSCGMALEPEVPVASTRTEYTCPMHPEIVRSEPGSCPICGMALEPRTLVAEHEENPELVSMTRRFWISVAFTVPVLFFGMSDMIPGNPVSRLISMQTTGWIGLFLATPVVLWAGWPFF